MHIASHIFVVHQAICMETVTHSLPCPMQMRENDVILNECPKSVTENPTEDHRSMTVTTDTNHQLRVPLRLQGVTSTICVSTPTQDECLSLPRMDPTNQDPTSVTVCTETLVIENSSQSGTELDLPWFRKIALKNSRVSHVRAHD